jgi:hypothetical protein
MTQAGRITERFAKKIAKAVKQSEADSRHRDSSTPKRIPRATGLVAIEWVKLTEDLLRDDIASGTLLYQSDDPDADGTGGDWTEGAEDYDTVTVYAKHLTGTINLIPDGYKLASGCVVACSRNPQSGLLNLLQSTCCPVAV